MLIVGGHENDLGHPLLIDHAQQLEAVHHRHFDVQKQHLGVFPLNHLDRFEGIAAAADQLEALGSGQQLGQFLTGQVFIIND